MRFGLSDLEELPSLKEFEALAAKPRQRRRRRPSESSDERVLDAAQDVAQRTATHRANNHNRI